MRKLSGLIINNSFAIAVFIIWKIYLLIIGQIAPDIVPLNQTFLYPDHWGNFDGIFYLHISQWGYVQYTEAFFPMYPVMINLIRYLTGFAPILSALVISNLAFFSGLIIFYNSIKDSGEENARWSTLFLAFYPASFFFSAVYTESLFFLLSVCAVYLIGKRKWFWGSIFGALASATRLVGIFLFVYALAEYFISNVIAGKAPDGKGQSSILPNRRISTRFAFTAKNIKPLIYISLIPLGLFSYMIFLYFRNHDALAFFHIQPLFGANRSGSKLVLLPQVYWRYLKIIFTAYLKPTALSYFISIWELIITSLGILVLWKGRKILNIPLIIYTAAVFLTPTFTGTFSSMPRYVLSAFPLFIILPSLYNIRIRILLLAVFALFLAVNESLFIQGWFVG